MPPIPDGPIEAQLKTLDKDKPTIVKLLLKLHKKHLRLPEFSPPDSEGESYNTFRVSFYIVLDQLQSSPLLFLFYVFC